MCVLGPCSACTNGSCTFRLYITEMRKKRVHANITCKRGGTCMYVSKNVFSACHCSFLTDLSCTHNGINMFFAKHIRRMWRVHFKYTMGQQKTCLCVCGLAPVLCVFSILIYACNMNSTVMV